MGISILAVARIVACDTDCINIQTGIFWCVTVVLFPIEQVIISSEHGVEDQDSEHTGFR